MTRFPLKSLCCVLLSALSLTFAAPPVQAASGTTQTVTITQNELTAVLNQASASTSGIVTLSVQLGTNQFTLNAKVTTSGATVTTVSIWKPYVSQGILIFNVTSATVNGKSASSSTLSALTSFTSQVRVAFAAELQAKGYAYPTYLVISYSSTSSAMTLVVQKNTTGTPVGTAKAGNIPVSGGNSAEDDVLNTSYSQNWAGYVVTTPAANGHLVPLGDITDISAQWTIPTITCGPADTFSATWIGIDGFGDPTVEQTGTSQDCVSGQPSYYAWFELYPRPSRDKGTLTVNAGDVISAEIKVTGRDGFVITQKDITTGETFTVTRPVTGALRRTAEWIEEAPLAQGQIQPLTDFNVMLFTAASLTSAKHSGPINDPAWVNRPITMLSADAVTVKAQSSLLGEDGASFDVAFLSSH